MPLTHGNRSVYCHSMNELKAFIMKNIKLVVAGALAVVMLASGAFFYSGNVNGQEGGKDKVEAWQMRCNADEQGNAIESECEIVQQLIAQETGRRFLEFVIGFKDSNTTANGVVILPLGILLEPGVNMVIDDNQPLKFKVRYCDATGCYSVISLPESVLNMMRKGKEAYIIMRARNNQQVRVAVSLDGFSKALNKIQK